MYDSIPYDKLDKAAAHLKPEERAKINWSRCSIDKNGTCEFAGNDGQIAKVTRNGEVIRPGEDAVVLSRKKVHQVIRSYHKRGLQEGRAAARAEYSRAMQQNERALKEAYRQIGAGHDLGMKALGESERVAPYGRRDMMTRDMVTGVTSAFPRDRYRYDHVSRTWNLVR